MSALCQQPDSCTAANPRRVALTDPDQLRRNACWTWLLRGTQPCNSPECLCRVRPSNMMFYPSTGQPITFHCQASRIHDRPETQRPLRHRRLLQQARVVPPTQIRTASQAILQKSDGRLASIETLQLTAELGSTFTLRSSQQDHRHCRWDCRKPGIRQNRVENLT